MTHIEDENDYALLMPWDYAEFNCIHMRSGIVIRSVIKVHESTNCIDNVFGYSA